MQFNQKATGPGTVAIILVGDELLSGETKDVNGALLLESFRALGVSVRSLCVVGDDVADIAEAVAREAARVDHVLTSGGVGPTHDDVTLEAVAEAFGRPLVFNETLAARIDEDFGAEGATALEAWRAMAHLPEGCALVGQREGGWPVFRVENVYVLAGSPRYFSRQFEAIKGAFHGGAVSCRTILMKVNEGALAAPLREAATRFETVRFGSYPTARKLRWRVRVTVETREGQPRLDEACQWLLAHFTPAQIHGFREEGVES